MLCACPLTSSQMGAQMITTVLALCACPLSLPPHLLPDGCTDGHDAEVGDIGDPVTHA